MVKKRHIVHSEGSVKGGSGLPRLGGEAVGLAKPRVDAALLAALDGVDLRAAHAGAALIVATCLDALDDLCGCIGQCNPQIRAKFNRAKRLVRLGKMVVRQPIERTCEMSERDRLVPRHLTEQVSHIAEQIECFGEHDLREALGGATGCRCAGGVSAPVHSAIPTKAPTPFVENAQAFFFSSVGSAADSEPELSSLVEAASPTPLGAKEIRRIIRRRQQRGRFFETNLFADPAWDMLLDLFAAHAEKTRVSVTSLCIASGIPSTTALRWIGQMIETGLVQRHEDETDRRRAFITLTDKTMTSMTRFFAHLEPSATLIM